MQCIVMIFHSGAMLSLKMIRNQTRKVEKRMVIHQLDWRKSTGLERLVYNGIHIGYTMKRRGIRDLDQRRNRLFRHPERVARGRLIRFPR